MGQVDETRGIINDQADRNPAARVDRLNFGVRLIAEKLLGCQKAAGPTGAPSHCLPTIQPFAHREPTAFVKFTPAVFPRVIPGLPTFAGIFIREIRAIRG
jgi:hypothetical protein